MVMMWRELPRTSAIKGLLERAAAADTRSLSSLLEVIVKEWLKTKGQTTD